MKLYDLPFIPSGYKTALAGWGLLLVGIGQLSYTIGNLFLGNADLSELMPAFQVFTAGLAVIGIGHKGQKIQDNLDNPNG